ncbi:MAG: U32 family peptidase [Spirochaetales bacterium]|nr:U32 family peptidase [Spirochaetales bacterium]
MKPPKILAPAGDVTAFKAALLAGADEIYFGLPKFNARMNAANITVKDLGHLMRLAHSRGTRAFLTVNVLFAENELDEVIRTVGLALDEGVDGFIVQDYAAFPVLLQEFPGAELHASTQMTTHNRGQVSLLARLGASRVNLSRELTLSQIEHITHHAHRIGIGTEVFVHGAYCISFSGQCYMSSFIGGLSGNRGLCFQPCRRRYFCEGGGSWPEAAQGAVDGGPVRWADPTAADSPAPRASEFPLSLKDNSALPYAPALVAAGVDSLKIEGRMKNAHYVYNVVHAWRRRLDSIAAGGKDTGEDDLLFEVFNRGFTAGYLEGAVSKGMFGDTPFDHSLPEIGRVERFHAGKMMLTVSPVREKAAGAGKRPVRGDSLTAAGAPDAVPPGAEIMIVSPTNRRRCRAQLLSVRTSPSKPAQAGSADLYIKILNKLEDRIQPGDIVLWNRSAQKAHEIAARADELDLEPLKLEVSVTGSLGTPLEAVFRTTAGGRDAVARIVSTTVLEQASRAPLTVDDLKRQFGRLGGTMFALEGVTDRGLAPDLFLPVSELNTMRRLAVISLEQSLLPAARVAAGAGTTAIGAIGVVAAASADVPKTSAEDRDALRRTGAISLLVSRPEDAEEAAGLLETGDRIVLEVGCAAEFPQRGSFIPYFPLITTDDVITDYKKLMERHDRSVINNAGLISFSEDPAEAIGAKWIAGPGFNLTNSRAVGAMAKAGAAGGFLSNELSRDQLLSALQGMRLLEKMEVWVPVFGPVSLMTTMQCLSQTCSKAHQNAQCLTSCGYSAELSDEARNRFHVIKRPWSYTTIYNALPLALPRAIADLIRDVDYFVVDFRRLPPLELSSSGRAEILRIFLTLRKIARRSGAGGNLDSASSRASDEIRSIVGDTTWGNYRRGLSSGDKAN